MAISNSRRWFIIALLFTASLINYIDRGTISVALPLIAHDLHFGPELKGVLLSAFFWSYAVMQVPVGWAADRFNIRYLYPAMFLLWSIAQGLTGWAAGLGVLIILRVLLGVGESVYYPGGVKIVSRLFARTDRGFPTGLFNCGICAGIAVGAPLTALLISRYGWRHMFLIVGAIALLWLAPWFAVFPSHLPRTDSEEQPPAISSPRTTIRSILTFDRNLLGICLGSFCWGYFWYVLVTWLPDYLVTVRHLRVLTAGFYAALPFLVFTVSAPLGGWLTDRIIRFGLDETIVRKTVVTVTFLFGLLVIPATQVHSPLLAIWLIAGASLNGAGWPNISVFAQCCAPEDEVGVWAGVSNFILNIGGVVAPLVTGFLIARTSSYSSGFIVGAVILVLAIFPFWFILGELKPRVHRRKIL